MSTGTVAHLDVTDGSRWLTHLPSAALGKNGPRKRETLGLLMVQVEDEVQFVRL